MSLGGQEPELAAPGLGVLAEPRRLCALVGRAELRRCFRDRRDRADADVLAVAELEPLLERPLREDGCELGGELVLCRVELPRAEVGSTDHRAESLEERLLQRGDRQPAAVGAAIGSVACEPPGEESWHRLATESVG